MAIEPNNPRVIVVGGGPVGLYTAHALTKANIDYVVLEQQPEVVRVTGAGIVLLPNTMRLLDQIGLCERAEKIATRLNNKVNSLQNGRELCRYPLFGSMEEAFGYYSVGFSRREFLQILYESLPDRETRIRTNARVVNIETHDNGVRVHLEDGSIEEGSLVIGVDGVHSKTREIMRTLARASTESKEDVEAYPMVASFQGFFGRAPFREDIPQGCFFEGRGTGMASQGVNGNEFMYFAVLRALPKPTTDRRRYTDQEVQEEAERLQEINIFPTVKFKEIWATCDPKDFTLVHIEEGFVDKWHHGRIVLLGDAVHKMTPINGNGVNTGLQSAAVLVNQLHGILSSGSDFTDETLGEAFERYQTIREKACREVCNQGAMLTRLVTWSTWTGWFFDRFIMPWMNLGEVAKKQTRAILKYAHVLDFVPFESRVGEIPWANMPKAKV
ncbi:putative dehydrogenase [Hypoxylon cercidicola]|nr:putative dehydrogenase [Hypoxylon cercidicola]